MNRNIFKILLFLTIGVLGMQSCRDELLYDPSQIREGVASIKAEVSFHPLISALDQTRAAGDAIRNIETLQIIIYDDKGEFFRSEKLTTETNNLVITDAGAEGANTSMPKPYDKKSQSEEKTAKASFKLNNIPFGRYYMYVVANYNGTIPLDKENIGTPYDLKKITVKWNTDPKELSQNSQMFGCLATNAQKDYDFQAPLLTINKSGINLHAWIKRLASKLTLVFDGSGLHEGIFVYINKATIRDIPKYCHLGVENSPFKDAEGKYANREEIPENMSDSIIDKGESLYYNAKGEVSSSKSESVPANPDFTYIQNNWLEIDKSTTAGAVSILNGTSFMHPENAQALYFYENCQGKYDDQPKFDKKQYKETVGEIIKEGETSKSDYKDEVICGTYVEVEGYYSANYDGYISSGPIKYRFMLGQDVDYDYNALRNRHYKLTLKFKGYANQPDWHIEYEDEEPGLYPPDEYLMSYMYNVRHEMPIRLTGHPTKVTMQIIENNWAPYYDDPTKTNQKPEEQVPEPEISGPNGGLPFKWNKEVYADSKYFYGLHSLESHSSTPSAYGPNILETGKKYQAPEWVSRNVTPIWVGFLALQAPSEYESYDTPLPAGIYNVRFPTEGQENFYDRKETIDGMKGYFYGSGDRADLENGEVIRPANSIPLYQSVFKIPGKDKLSETESYFNSGENDERTGRNQFKAKLNGDGSVTIYAPMFTMPKDMGYITGFSGNNPYECYYRRAVVKITAEYEGQPDIVKYVPIFQTRRIVNPKAVWRTSNNSDSFEVTLMCLEAYNEEKFTPLESRGVWEAWVATPGNESTPTEGTFSLEVIDGARTKKEGNKIKGITGSNISFRIKFANIDKNKTECGKIIVHYHDNNCEHSIYIRKGYNVPVKVGDGVDDKEWSSYAIYSFDSANEEYGGVFKPIRNNGVWSFPSHSIAGLKATLTVNPLALGTMYKRGNYAEGIRISNNKIYNVLQEIDGKLQLTKTNINKNEEEQWGNITGIPYLGYSYSSLVWTPTNVNAANNWEWSQFESTVPAVDSDNTYIYDLPTIDDYKSLMTQGFGIGVAYADGATKTAETQDAAFGYFNDNNEGYTGDKGMRGFIVYNLKNFNQIFFPLGYSGVGRRTIQNTNNKPGVLRYGNQADVLSVGRYAPNQYRPIPYNNPNNPGVIYWAKKKASEEALYAMDMNYFDLTFAPYDYAVDFVDYGDAIPIKPVVIEKVTNTINPAARSKKKAARK